jgi:FkbH-like protein
MEFHQWLPVCATFGSRLKELDGATRDRQIAGLKFLSQHRLDFVKTNALAAKIATAISSLPEDCVAQCGPTVNVALLSSHTVSHLTGGIAVGALRRGFNANFFVGQYGLYRNELLEPDPSLQAFAPDVIVIAVDVHDVSFDLSLDAKPEDVRFAIDAKVSELVRIWRQARLNFHATIVQQTLLNTHHNMFGSYEGLLPATPYSATELFNGRLREAASQEGVLVLDIALHAALKGHENIVDPVRWHQAKQLVSPILSPWYGDLLARVIAATYGLAKKAIVLDLDNTLWGGVVGDDGIEGIVLGQGNAAGEAYIDFQKYLLRLSERGIILAVCSKNESAVAENVFNNHPDMVLRRGNIASFVANWDDKASNIRRIASDLNIGLDSLVFVDDNPAEREIIRRELPMVSVPELPRDIAHYGSYLSNAGYFEAASFSKEDIERADLYKTNSIRQQGLSQATDLEGFLESLQMRLEVGPVSKMNIGRVTQLTNKTNQFNLRTVKYTEPEVDRLMRDRRTLALQFRLKDKFGDNGIIAVIFARPDPRWPADTLFIDTWLMSCRVLSRGVEAASLEALSRYAEDMGVKQLVGEYRATSRNKMVSDHYEKLGFQPLTDGASSDSSSTIWCMDLPQSNGPQHHIEVNIANDHGTDLRRAHEDISRSLSG